MIGSWPSNYKGCRASNSTSTSRRSASTWARSICALSPLGQERQAPIEPPIPDVSGPAVTRGGDLWLIGRHKLLCGDTRSEAAHAELTPEAFTEFLTAALELVKESRHPGSLAYVCMDWRHIGELLDPARSNLLDMLNLCVWTKPNAGMGSLYRSQHELVFVFKL